MKSWGWDWAWLASRRRLVRAVILSFLAAMRMEWLRSTSLSLALRTVLAEAVFWASTPSRTAAARAVPSSASRLSMRAFAFTITSSFLVNWAEGEARADAGEGLLELGDLLGGGGGVELGPELLLHRLALPHGRLELLVEGLDASQGLLCRRQLLDEDDHEEADDGGGDGADLVLRLQLAPHLVLGGAPGFGRRQLRFQPLALLRRLAVQSSDGTREWQVAGRRDLARLGLQLGRELAQGRLAARQRRRLRGQLRLRLGELLLEARPLLPM